MNTESTVGSRGQEDHLSATEMGRHNRVWPDPKRSKVRAEPPPPTTHTHHHTPHPPHSHVALPSTLCTRSGTKFKWVSPNYLSADAGRTIVPLGHSQRPHDQLDKSKQFNERSDRLPGRTSRQALLQTECSRSQKEIVGHRGTVSV